MCFTEVDIPRSSWIILSSKLHGRLLWKPLRLLSFKQSNLLDLAELIFAVLSLTLIKILPKKVMENCYGIHRTVIR